MFLITALSLTIILVLIFSASPSPHPGDHIQSYHITTYPILIWLRACIAVSFYLHRGDTVPPRLSGRTQRRRRRRKEHIRAFILFIASLARTSNLFAKSASIPKRRAIIIAKSLKLAALSLQQVPAYFAFISHSTPSSLADSLFIYRQYEDRLPAVRSAGRRR